MQDKVRVTFPKSVYETALWDPSVLDPEEYGEMPDIVKHYKDGSVTYAGTHEEIKNLWDAAIERTYYMYSIEEPRERCTIAAWSWLQKNAFDRMIDYAKLYTNDVARTIKILAAVKKIKID